MQTLGSKHRIVARGAPHRKEWLAELASLPIDLPSSAGEQSYEVVGPAHHGAGLGLGAAHTLEIPFMEADGVPAKLWTATGVTQRCRSARPQCRGYTGPSASTKRCGATAMP